MHCSDHRRPHNGGVVAVVDTLCLPTCCGALGGIMAIMIGIARSGGHRGRIVFGEAAAG